MIKNITFSNDLQCQAAAVNLNGSRRPLCPFWFFRRMRPPASLIGMRVPLGHFPQRSSLLATTPTWQGSLLRALLPSSRVSLLHSILLKSADWISGTPACFHCAGSERLSPRCLCHRRRRCLFLHNRLTLQSDQGRSFIERETSK